MNFKLIKKTFTNLNNVYSFAVIGSGPGGFYSAKHLLRKYSNLQIDFYEKLPHPFGLVRTGVAPDHQEVKNVEKDFESVLEDSRVRFLGNVEVGKDIPLDTLQNNYSGLIFSYGADTENKLNLKYENNFGCFSARDFVSWYNGHIFYCRNSIFNQVDLSQVNDVVIIGNGNVAVDVARILSKQVDQLREFDVPELVLDKLSNSKVKNIHIVARRGPVQAAFTVKEMRELSKVEGVKMYIYRDELDQMGESALDKIMPAERRQVTRKLELMNSFNIIDRGDKLDSNSRINIFLRFLLTPDEFIIDSKENVKGIKFIRNSPDANDSNNSKNDDNLKEIINSNLIFRSIGYKNEKLFNSIKFDNTSNNLYHVNGVLYDSNDFKLDNHFCVGWVKTGSKGIIDYTLRDSYQTADSIFKAINTEAVTEKTPDYDSIKSHLNMNKRTFTYEDWKSIDQYEIGEGRKLNKIREKVIDFDKMLSFLN